MRINDDLLAYWWLVTWRKMMASLVSPMRRVIRAAAALAILLLGYVGWVSYGIASEGGKDEVRPADVILVLGSMPEEDGRPTAMLRGRVEHAVALYQRGWAPRLMLLGGVVDNRANQAQLMARVAAQMGVPQEAMILEESSKTTLEGVKFSKEIMAQEGLKSAIVVTSLFHTARALAMYRDAGVEVYGSPARQSEKGLSIWQVLGLWVREWGATTLYKLSVSP